MAMLPSIRHVLALVLLLCINVSAETVQHPFTSLTKEAKEDMAMLAAVEPQSLVFAAKKPAMVTIGDSQTMFGSAEGGWVNKMFSSYKFSVDVLNKARARQSNWHPHS